MKLANTAFSLAAAVCLVACLAPAVHARTGSLRKLTTAEMEALVLEYARDEGDRQHLSLQDDGEVPNYPGFRYYDVITDDPSSVFAAIDHVAIDEATGDLWFPNACDPDDSPRVERMKQEIRRKIGMTAADYEKIRRPGPYCDGAKQVP